LITLYPLFQHARCAVSTSFLCIDKCGIVISGIISSRKSFSSDSTDFFCVGDIVLLLCLCYQILSVVQCSGGIREICRHEYAGIGGTNILFETSSFVFTVGSPLVQMDYVVGQLETELVNSGIAMAIQSIGRGIMVVIILTFNAEGVGCKND
ncbi:MAG: hypothetical protein EZS28_037628, partial [Streblomastix strix]